MLLVCPTCSTSYDIAAAKLGAGREVRCARCLTRWFACALPEAEPLTVDESPTIAELATDRALVPWAHSSQSGLEPESRTQPIASTASPDDAAIQVWTEGAPPLAPTEIEPPDARVLPPEIDTGADIETVAAQRAQIAQPPRPKKPRRRSAIPLAIVLLLGVAVALVGWRSHIVRAAPQSAALYAAIGLPVNLRGLTFEDVKTSDEMHEGVPVLVVDGKIVNVSKRTLDVPRLRFAVRNAAGVEVYAWTAQPEQQLLGVGETLSFRSRLASPPTEARDVVVRFFHRRDLAASR